MSGEGENGVLPRNRDVLSIKSPHFYKQVTKCKTVSNWSYVTEIDSDNSVNTCIYEFAC
jgi:hypothetical protein